METFVSFCYAASIVVFCAGIVGFIVWDSAALAYWSRNRETPPQEIPQRGALPLGSSRHRGQKETLDFVASTDTLSGSCTQPVTG
jgi:hypothetical protein